MRALLRPLVIVGCCACGATTAVDSNDCGDGDCGSLGQPFVCQVAVPEQGPAAPATVMSERPAATGGVVRDGTYQMVAVHFPDHFDSIPGETLEIRGGYYHRNRTTYSARTGEAMTGFEEAGRLSAEGSALTFEGTACVGGSPASHAVVEYSVNEARLSLLRRSGNAAWEEIYLRR